MAPKQMIFFVWLGQCGGPEFEFVTLIFKIMNIQYSSSDYSSLQT